MGLLSKIQWFGRPKTVDYVKKYERASYIFLCATLAKTCDINKIVPFCSYVVREHHYRQAETHQAKWG
jgi:predicted GNAT family acetyltransferase